MQTGTCMIVLMIFSVDIYICNVEGGHNGVKTVLKLHCSFWQRYTKVAVLGIWWLFIYYVFGFHVDPAKQQRALNLELDVINQLFSVILVAYNQFKTQHPLLIGSVNVTFEW